MKKKGVGISLAVHPSGFSGGGDPSQAQIRLKLDGTIDLLIGSSEIGQGCKTIMRQIAADELGMPLELITLSNSDTDIAPFSTGTIASRVTFMDGNAVINAAADFKAKLKNFVARQFGLNSEHLDVADTKVFVRNNSEQSMSMAEIGAAVTWSGECIVGTGAYIPGPLQKFEPETGKMTNVAAIAFACCVAEVEVDTETGAVDVLKLIHVTELGKAINPQLCKMQMNGGAMMGLSFALMENSYPYYPHMDFAAKNLEDYVLTTAADMPLEMITDIVEIPHPKGPHGAKGFGEMSASVPPPAILSAIHDAIGVWIMDYPATPERILRALEANGAKE